MKRTIHEEVEHFWNDPFISTLRVGIITALATLLLSFLVMVAETVIPSILARGVAILVSIKLAIWAFYQVLETRY